MMHSIRLKAVVLAAVLQAVFFIVRKSPFDGMDTRITISRSVSNNLVVFNALGARENLALVEHNRRKIFKPDEWDCVAFMFANGEEIPDDDVHLKHLKDDELACTVVRKPGQHWGDFLQYITPVFVSNYDYVALVLDDVFMPHDGQYAVNTTKLIERMQDHNVASIQPGMVGPTHDFMSIARTKRISQCLVSSTFIETYAQIFTRDAWECYYKMLDYTGGRGWCYDICFKKQCPGFTLAQDLSMRGWHMDKGITELPKDELYGANVTDWKPSPRITANGYMALDPTVICRKLQCGVVVDLSLISCPV